MIVHLVRMSDLLHCVLGINIRNDTPFFHAQIHVLQRTVCELECHVEAGNFIVKPANKSLTRIFKGRRERTGHSKKQSALPRLPPSLRIIRFQGRTCLLKRKENSSLGTRWRLLGRLCCHTLSTSRFRNINLIPFR